MMSKNKSKDKGTRWERDLAKELEEHSTSSKRIPGSGAIGTQAGIPRLTGDVTVKYKFLPWPIKVECKYGYGGSKQMTIFREWMSKVRSQAESNKALPAVAIKFRDVTSGDIESAKWICFSVEDWNKVVEYLNDLFEDLDGFWSWKYEKENK